MNQNDWLAREFEENRDRLRGVAYRMLGSANEAEDAVQESWLRLTRTGSDDIGNLSGWLTTVVARVCLDMLRSRKSRREDSLNDQPSEPAASRKHAADPEQEALLASSVGLALLVVLDRLNPAERLAFVLHDLFDVSFDEIASIVGRTPAATRQLASRARRQVRGAKAPPKPDLSIQRGIVAEFLTALRGRDLQGLLTVLDPDLIVHADQAAGVAREVRGAEAWARQAIVVAQGARAAQLALIDGAAGVVVAPRGRLLMVLRFTMREGRISEINVVADPKRLAELSLAVL
jgi:RNA polymerase sigma factor (sigma-70 family)